MQRNRMILLSVLLAACGPEAVSVVTEDTAAKYIAVDLHHNWTLSVSGVCDQGGGWMDIETTLASDALAVGNGSWGCGSEGGFATVRVSTSGEMELSLFRGSSRDPTVWHGTGTYAPKMMIGSFVDATIATPCQCFTWSATYP